VVGTATMVLFVVLGQAVSLTADKAPLHPGDSIWLRASVAAENSESLQWGLVERSPELVLRSRESLRVPGGFEVRYELIALGLGEHFFGPVSWTLTSDRGDRTVESAGCVLQAVPRGERPAVFPALMEAPAEEAPADRRLLLVVLGGVLLISIAGFVLGRGRAPVLTGPASRREHLSRARHRLGDLNRRLAAGDEPAQIAVSLVELLKNLFAGGWELRAHERTTEELLAALEAQVRVGDLVRVFEVADLAKFARRQPGGRQVLDCALACGAFLDRLESELPRPEEEAAA